MHGRLSAAFLLAVLLVAPVVAQESPVALDEAPLYLHADTSVTRALHIDNPHTDQPVHFDVQADPPGGSEWRVTATPQKGVIAAGDGRQVTITIEAPRLPSPRSFDLVVVVDLVADDFTADSHTSTFQVQATGTDAILGRWDNPLPAPLDNDLGSFILNQAAWWVIALVSMWLISPTLRILTSRTQTELDDKVIKIISRPVFILIFTFGLVRSIQVFALPVWVFNLLEQTWTIVLGIAVVYVGYRLWHAVVLALGRRLARNTESELDDRLYPVFEKVGGIIIIVVGTFYILGSFGIDLTLFAAGGAIGGLVIAFAAQDTLANFFAGIFILLDRPFRVGDRIELPEQEHWGDVQRIGLRTTSVRTQDNRMVIFPNSYIGSTAVVNHSYPDVHYRIQVDFRLPYGSDVEFVRKTLVEAAKEVEGVWGERAPEALLLEFTEQGQGWRLRWWINSYVDTRRMFDRVNSAVIKRMAAEGIRIAYHQITLWDAHKLLERESTGGLAPRQLAEDERTALEVEAEASRKTAEAQEVAEVERVKQQAKKRQETRARRLEEDAEE